MSNPKHTFDFEAILGAKIDQNEWKSAKQKLESQFGELKIAIEDGLAENEAKKYIELFNKVFAKAKMPDIGIEDLIKNFDKVSEGITKAIGLINNIDTSVLKGIETSVDKIATQVDKIVDKIEGAKSSGGDSKLFDNKQLDQTLKIVSAINKKIKDVQDGSEIDAAIDRLGKSKHAYKDIEKLLGGKDKSIKDVDLLTHADNFRTSVKGNDPWEIQYQHMLRYIKAYESFIESQHTESVKQWKLSDAGKDATNLYNRLIPQESHITIALQDIVNRHNGQELAADKSKPWAREKTLQDIKDILNKGVGGDNSDEGNNETDNPKKPRQGRPKQENDGSFRVYKGIVPPKDKEASLSREKFESWTDQKVIAEKYADQAKDGVVLVGTISPKNPLVIDAGGKKMDVFSSMPGAQTDYFKQNFANILTQIQGGILKEENDIKAAINARAKELGHDVVQFENISEKMYSESESDDIVRKVTGKLNTSFSILDESVLKVSQSFKQLRYDAEEGIGEYPTPSSEIPEYYPKPLTDASSQMSEIVEEAAAHKENAEAIHEEVIAQEKLNAVKDSVDSETLEEIKQETGALEDKLSRLQELSDAWGKQITDNKRNRYEDLNQKEMDEGLTSREEGRMSELYEEISEADEALEEFEQTYNKIILKLANGKKVTIWPNDKGLRDLYKFGDEYGESYNGIEIEDVIFERKKQEVVENEKLAITYDKLKEKVEAYYKVKNEAVKLHNAGQDISHLGPSLRAMEEDIAQYFDKYNEDPSHTADGVVMRMQSAVYDSEPSKALDNMAQILGIEMPAAVDKSETSFDELNKKFEETQQKIKKTNQIISNAKDWIEYLDNVLDDNNFKTTGKKDATEQLRSKTHTLIDYRMHPDSYKGLEYAEEKIKIAWQKAYDEAKRQGVAESTLTKYNTDVYDVDKDIQKLQNEKEYRVKLLKEQEVELKNLQQISDETKASIDNLTVSLEKQLLVKQTRDNEVVETQAEVVAQAKLNEELKEAADLTAKIKTASEVGTHGQSLADVSSSTGGADATVGANMQELQNVLSNITYSVKIVNDDTDKTANKIALDDSLLEATLNKVFANILNPQTEQNDENNQLLQVLKDISNKVGNIQSNGEYNDINPHYVTDANGRPVTVYRGIRDSYAGLVSNRGHGGTFSTDDLELAKRFAGSQGKVEKAFISMKNPLEIDGNGADYNKILYLGNGADEASKNLRRLQAELTKTQKELENIEARITNLSSNPQQNADDIAYYKKSYQDILDENNAIQKQMRIIFDDPTNPYNFGDTNKFVDIAKQRGYDGVIFKNIKDGLDKASNLFATFQEKQIHSIETLSSTDNYQEKHTTKIDDVESAATQNNSALSAIKTAVESIDKKIVQGTKSITVGKKSSSKSEIKTSEKYNDSQYFAEKLKTQSLYLDKFEAKLLTTGRLTDEYAEKINKLRKDLGTIQNGPELSKWSEQFKQLKTKVGITDILGDYGDLEVQVRKIGELEAMFAMSGNIKTKEKIDSEQALLNAEINRLAITEEERKLLIDSLNEQRREAREQAFMASEASVKEKDRLQTIKDIEQLYRKIGEIQAKQLFGVGVNEDIDDIRNRIAQKQANLSPDDVARIKSDDIIASGQSDAEASIKVDILNKLRSQYVELGKLEAQRFSGDNTEELKTHIEQLQKKIKLEKESLKLNDNALALLDHELNQRLLAAQEAEKELIIAREADKAAKQKAKDEKAALRAEMKDVRDKSRVAKAASTWRSGKDTYGMTMNMVDDDNNISIDDVMDHEAIAKLNDSLNDLAAIQEKVNKQIKDNKPVTEEDAVALQKQTAATQQQISAVKELQKNYEFFSSENSASLNQTYTGGNLEEQLKQAITLATNGKAKFGEYDATLGRWTYTVKGANNTVEHYTAGLRGLDNQLRTVHTSTKQTESLLETIGRKVKEVFTYFSGSSIIYKLFGWVKQGIQYVREIDSALTELKKVTDETEETYDKFLDTAAKTADKVGSTIKEVVSSTADFARLGYSLKEAAEFAESAQILMNVSEFTDVSRATDTLISAVQAFGYTAETSMDVVDLLNTIGNNYAISTADLAQSLTKSSASLVAAGGNLAEAAALTATANKIIQDADSVGTALKTTSLRLRGTDVSVLEEEGLDSEGAVTSKSKLQSKVKALSGIDILTATGEYKSTYEILSQIADVWEDINDMDQAALLELISGKRNSSVIASILQNPEELKEAFEDASSAEGSALEENEKYLDSIQGRIDLLTNSFQTLWQNILSSDIIKFVVNILTQIVKIVDNIGLIGTALSVVLVYLTAFKKQTPLDLLKGIWGLIKNIGSSIKANGFGQWIGSLFGVVPALKTVTGATVENTLATQINDKAKEKQILTDMGLLGVTEALTPAQREQAKTTILNAMATGQLTTAQGNAILAMLGFSAATYAADGSLQALDVTTKSFMASNPVGWVLIIISVLIVAINLLSLIPSKVESLTEKLDDLKSGLQDIQSELDNVNSELETTQDRMAELLAMPSLSFTEQEELNRLKEQTAELERQEAILKAREEREKKRVADTATEVVEAQFSATSYKGEWWNQLLAGLAGAISIGGSGAAYGSTFGPIGTLIGGIGGAIAGFIGGATTEYLHYRVSTEDRLNEEIENYQTLIDKRNNLQQELIDAKDEESRKTIEAKLEEVKTEIKESDDYIDGTLAEIEKNLEGVEYGQGADETLDKYWNLMYKREISLGTIGADQGIAHILDRPEHEQIKKELNNYVKSLENVDDNAKKHIESIIQNEAALVADINAMGLEISDAVDYLTMSSKGLSEDIIANYDKGLNALAKFENNEKIDFTNKDGTVEQIGFDNLFDTDGEVLSSQISKVMQGADEKTRQEFEKLMKAVKDGKYNFKNELGEIEVNWEAVTKSWNISGGLRVIEEEMAQLSQINLEVFPGLEDEIQGIIDSFDELISAVSNTVDAMDALEQARAEEAYSGSVSLETLEKLMKSTDNYAELIEVDETGAITLAIDAQDLFIQEKINTIKQNAALALSQAQLRLEEAKHNQQIYQQSSPAQEVLRSVVAEVGGAVAFVTSLWGDLTKGNFDGAWERAKGAAQSAKNEKQQGWATQAAQVTTSVAEAEKAVANAQKMNDIAQGLTKENIKSRSDSSTASGGNSTVKDVENDKFQEAMDYWENRIAANQAKYEQIQNEIDLLEAKGIRAGEEYYREQIELENERKFLLEQQKAEALKYLGTLKEGSDEWWEVAETVNSIEGELDDVIASVQELNDAIGQIRWDGFEQLHDRFSNLTTDLENIRDILSNEDMFDDEGNFTKEGVANLATYIQELEIYKNALADVQEELVDFQQGYEGNEDYFATIGIYSEQEYYDKVTELTDKQDDYVKSIKDTEQSVVEMYENQIDAIEEYIGELIDGYNDYIDVVKESLDAERDLYEFKKKIKDQTKDIASLERRIASLSGSTNASDIAERRKLEAELYEAKEGLNDTYYDHAKDSQSQALDEEAQAYEESMNRYVEGLRTTLEEAQNDMSTFLSTVTNLVVQNAGSIEETFKDTGLALDSAIVDPWTKAAEEMVGFEEGALSRMNDWTQAGENGYFYNFNANATDQLKSPWSAGTNAANTFTSNVKDAMGEVYKSVQSNVDNSITKLNSLASVIKDTNVRADGSIEASTNKTSGGGYAVGSSSGVTDSKGGSINTNVERLQAILNKFFGANLTIDGDYGPATTAAVKKMQAKIGDMQDGLYTAVTFTKLKSYFANLGGSVSSWFSENGISIPGGIKKRNLLGSGTTTVHLNAKGTLGTKQDGWNITDESWIGEEITLAAGKNGQLQYLKKGSAVMPADISANLIEWGKLNPDMLNVGGGANINMISNAINKPEFNLNFEALVKADRIDEGTLPEVKKFVQQEINNLVKQMNYALKIKGAR